MTRILDPTLRAPAATTTMPRAPRKTSLDGVTIGLLANGKSNGMALLERVWSGSPRATRSSRSCGWPRAMPARR